MEDDPDLFHAPVHGLHGALDDISRLAELAHELTLVVLEHLAVVGVVTDRGFVPAGEHVDGV